jgi:hypothetical protein
MTATTIRVQMAQRKDTAANWTAANPILLSGEIGYETDTKKFKIGDGTTNWNNLAYLPIPDGSGNLTITGNLEIGTTGSLTFEGSTANGFETTLAVTDPTADRTITLPNVSGTVVTTGDTGSVTSTMIADGTIVNADISGSAEIAVSKLANGTANQVIVTDGTNVSWSDNLTLAGDLTVNGTTTTINTENLLVEDKNIIIGNVATPSDVTADGGGITLKGSTDKTINWVDSTDAWTSSERFSYPLGSAAAPSLTFTGDPNTGIYSPGADQVAISTNGTGRITVQSDGNVLIGATGLANRLLTVNQTGITGGEYGISISQTSATSNALELTIDSANALSKLFQKSTIPLVFGTNNTERMRLDSNGRLGLGTSSPVGLLDVRGEIKAGSFDSINGTTLLSDSYTTGGASFGSLCIERSSGAFTLTTNIKHAENAAGYISTNTIDFGKSALKLRSTGLFYATASASVVPIGDSVSLTDRFVITNAGNVGIGTTNPSTLLHLDTLNETTAITVAATTSTGGQLHLGIGGKSSGFQSIVATGNGLDIGTTLGAPITFFTNGTANERARIDSSGRLLVGTSSARSISSAFLGGGGAIAELQVEGTALAMGSFTSNRNDDFGPYLALVKSRGTAAGSFALVSNGDGIGALSFNGTDGSAALVGAAISAFVDGTPGANDMPGRLVFSTTADGASSPTERMRISNAGTTTLTSAASTAPFIANIGASEAARIDSSGRLLIGTSSDSGGALLQVNGDRVRIATAKTPASASDTGTTGEICWDANYIYVCTATNTWKRTTIATW